MSFTQKVAKEVSILVPKLIIGVRKNFFEIEELTSRQIIVLLLVCERGQVNITDIAANFMVSLPTITGITDRLVKKGYLIRSRSEDDRRAVFVSLTVKGKKFVNRFREMIKKRWQRILVHLTKEEQEAYLKILKKIVKALKQERYGKN